MQNRHIIFGAIFSALAFLPAVQAVVPPPDGCYPNFTTAEGCNAPELEIQELVGFRCFRIPPATSTPELAPERWLSTTRITTPQLGLELFLNTTGTDNTGVGANALVHPQLVVHGKNGEVTAVHYEQINNMLLNEFLKEHKKVEELTATVAQQQKGMEVLTAQLKEQAAQIQKVSAQLEVNKPAPQVVAKKR
jgi:hypothetical protein